MGTIDPIFRNLDADDPEPETTVIDSLCVNCGESGQTRLLLTKIPFYKDVILMSFECEHCGYQNNEIQSGGRIEEKGIRFTLKCETEEDLNRTLVKSDVTSVKIPELDFEIPAKSQKGEVTTVEGVIDRAITGLKQDQDRRIKEYPAIAAQIEEFMAKLVNLKDVKEPFTMIIEDAGGNCFLSNPNAPSKDPRAETTLFVRSKEQDHALGIYSAVEFQDEESVSGVILTPPEEYSYENIVSEVFQLPSNCPSCNAPCAVNSKLTRIPYFKEVLIMATNCDTCGYRSNEVKSGTGIEPRGIRIEINVSDVEGLTRDILKSDTCYLTIPEVELEVGPATLGGKFSTVEGLLVNIKEQLQNQEIMFGDSAEEEMTYKLDEFIKKLDKCIACEVPFTLVLDDPAGNSYAQSLRAPDPDDKLKVSHYERSFQQNEDLGLNDMNVDN